MRRSFVSQVAAATVFSAAVAGCASTSLPSPSIGGSQFVSSMATSAVADTTTSTMHHIKIPTSNDIQTDLISTVPTGFYRPVKGGPSFSIPSTAGTCGYTGTGTCNFYDKFTGSGNSITITTAVKTPTYAYTLMNEYSPQSGVQLATIEFFGGKGAKVTYALIGGEDIRDFYDGQYANTLSNGVTGVVATNVFSCVDPTACLGAGGTGNVHTGDQGTYRVDEQQYSLSPLNGQTLTKIVITDTDSSSTPLLLGLTVTN